uniref:Uncharacterized protein n=1 Tax=Rhizophagus irregularis (strain DAOM 181602 / DAOM 197198 / MUCL 43194) TaxID=747089 RepID=U9TPY6_RHIID
MPNCNGKCVSSHTIPESSVLKKISHAGNVLYPKYNSDLNIYECTSISTGKASAFPGFCIEHEDIFSGFERSGNFLDPSIATQNLRVIFSRAHEEPDKYYKISYLENRTGGPKSIHINNEWR